MHALVGTLIVVGAATLAGCTTVTADTKGPGIPFYTPVPHLVVSRTLKPPQFAMKTVETTDPGSNRKVVTTKPVRLVDADIETKYSILYLPKLDERFYLKLEAALGSVEANMVLTDGWMLESLNAKADSQTDENLKALAEVAGAVSGIAELARGTKDVFALEIYRMEPNGRFTSVFQGSPITIPAQQSSANIPPSPAPQPSAQP